MRETLHFHFNAEGREERRSGSEGVKGGEGEHGKDESIFFIHLHIVTSL